MSKDQAFSRARVTGMPPSPVEVDEAMEALRTWARQSREQRPEPHMICCNTGFDTPFAQIEWATAVVGAQPYRRMRERYPVDAILFRAELTGWCQKEVERLRTLRGGGGIVGVFSHVLAGYIERALPMVLGEDVAAW